jgi:hypothetical protein
MKDEWFVPRDFDLFAALDVDEKSNPQTLSSGEI